jgi:hypothetical protein
LRASADESRRSDLPAAVDGAVEQEAKARMPVRPAPKKLAFAKRLFVVFMIFLSKFGKGSLLLKLLLQLGLIEDRND